VKTMAEGIADLIMNRAIYQDREGEGMTAYDRESHEYQYCQNAAQSILELLTAAGFGPVKAVAEMAAIERKAMVWALRDAADAFMPNWFTHHGGRIDQNQCHREWLRARAATIEADQ
jgi:hypothetical protein